MFCIPAFFMFADQTGAQPLRPTLLETLLQCLGTGDLRCSWFPSHMGDDNAARS